MNSRSLNTQLSLAAALASGLSEATQRLAREVDEEADETLMREAEAQRRLEQDRLKKAEELVRRVAHHPVETSHIPKITACQPEPRRRSKRAQRVRERNRR